MFGDGGSGGASEPLPGPHPYQPGDKRLSIGAFYEGAYSDQVPLDNLTSHLYVYQDAMVNTASLADDKDRVEGLVSTKIVHAGRAWWGLGVHWDTPRDLSQWKTLYVSLKSADQTFSSVKIGMNNQNPFFVEAGKYGYAADGAWHSLAIPVADFVTAGLDVTQVAAPFVLSGASGTGGAALKVDDVYFTAN